MHNKEDALRIAEQTGCLFSEAVAALEAEPDPGLAFAAVASVMSFRRQRYGSSLSTLWHALLLDPQPAESEDELEIDQTVAFIRKLGLQPDDALVLAILYELQSPRMGIIKKAGFIDGWARLEAGTLEVMQQLAIPHLRNRFETDSSYFREVYRFTFRVNLAAGERMLPIETATAYWDLLLAPRNADLTAKWLEFIEGGAHPPAVSADTWNMLLEFFNYATLKDPALQNYDNSSAWPPIIDEFVEFLR